MPVKPQRHRKSKVKRVAATFLLFALLVPVFSCFAGDSCEDGNLIGGSVYSIQNSTEKEQYVFVSEGGGPGSDTWKRITLGAGAMVEVNYFEARFALIAYTKSGMRHQDKYTMQCKERYLLRRNGSTGVIELVRIQ